MNIITRRMFGSVWLADIMIVEASCVPTYRISSTISVAPVALSVRSWMKRKLALWPPQTFV